METRVCNERTFQLWEYSVSHGSLLIRSPKGPAWQSNIDIVCAGVEYLAAPRFLRGLKIAEVTDLELQHLCSILGKEVSSSNVHVLVSQSSRFPIVAASFKVQEHEGDIFYNPFE